MVNDLQAWKEDEVNPEENKVWEKFSYVKNGKVIFKNGVKFEKIEDEFNGEIAFKIVDDEHYEMAFEFRNQQQLDTIYKSFGI
ncbi:hypothetical protein D3C85_1039180 [compost metagenome]